MVLLFTAGACAAACGFGMEIRGGWQTPQEPATVTSPLSGPQLFNERGCSHCHLLNGEGGRKGPDLSNVGRRLSADAIRKQISEGGGAMPPYADALGAGELDALTEMLHRARKGK